MLRYLQSLRLLPGKFFVAKMTIAAGFVVNRVFQIEYAVKV